MHRLRGFDYKRPFFYMVTLKRLPERAVFLQISDEAEPAPQKGSGTNEEMWYNLGGELR